MTGRSRMICRTGQSGTPPPFTDHPVIRFLGRTRRSTRRPTGKPMQRCPELVRAAWPSFPWIVWLRFRRLSGPPAESPGSVGRGGSAIGWWVAAVRSCTTLCLASGRQRDHARPGRPLRTTDLLLAVHQHAQPMAALLNSPDSLRDSGPPPKEACRRCAHDHRHRRGK